MRIGFSTLLQLAGMTALAGTASAQSFNIDVADLALSPTTNYAGAAGQPGFWNVLTGGPPYAATISDLTGVPTGVTTNVVAVGNGLGDFTFPNAALSGDDKTLMEDCQDIGNGGTAPPSETTWTFTGLNNSNYEIIVYAWAPDNIAYVSSVSECGSAITAMVGGAWPGGFVEGTTHAVLTATVSGGMIEICVSSGGVAANFSSVNGFQFVEGGTAEPGTAVCFGDGSDAPCGCGNMSNPGSESGCTNSVSVGGVGAHLTTSGTASVTTPDLILDCSGVLTQPGLMFQGDNTIGGGTGITFGDGIRCCGQNVIRLSIINPPPGAEPVSVTFTVATTPAGVIPGDKRCYQYWYRDPNGPCASTFNLSNAQSVIWGS